MKRSFCLLLSLSLSGVLAGDWLVRLPSEPVCAVIGSSVVLPCSYDYPRDQGQQTCSLVSEMWCREQSRCVTQRYVFHSHGIFPDPAFGSRVQYLGEPGSDNCSLRISDLRASDAGTYVFYVITNHTTQKMPEQRGVQLLVADAVSAVAASVFPSEALEGQRLRLSCCSPAAAPETLFRWFKDTSATTTGSTLELLNVSEATSGTYRCQMQTGERVENSDELKINVQYPPRKTFIRSSEGPAEGLPVTLSCSSDANPPVRRFTWYRDEACGPAGLGGPLTAATPAEIVDTVSSSNMSTDREGLHCCLARNKHGSEMFTVRVVHAPEESTDGWMILTGVMIAVLLAIVAVFLGYMMRRKKSSRQQSYVLTETTVS